jgi:nucleoside-diphosphate-sugar epimerase
VKVLLTGGCGFVGSQVAAQLVALGDEVVLLDRAPRTDILRSLLSEDQVAAIPIENGDVADLEEMTRTAERHHIEAIAHLAFVMPPAETENPILATRVNAMGMIAVLETARRLSLRRVAWASSLGTYGPPLDRPIRDDTLPNPRNLYGAAKVLNEQQARVYAEHHGVDSIGVRFGVGYGPGRLQGWVAVTELLRHAALGLGYRMPAAGTGMPWIYVKDEAGAIVAALKAAGPARRHVYSLPGDLRPMEARVAFLRRLVPEARLELDSGSPAPWDYVATAITDELGWKPAHTMEVGFTETVNDYRREAGLPAAG